MTADHGVTIVTGYGAAWLTDVVRPRQLSGAKAMPRVGILRGGHLSGAIASTRRATMAQEGSVR